MKVNLAFGKTGLEVALPDSYHYHVLQAHSAQPLDDPRSALAAALKNPIAGPSLADLARGKRSAAISICDITRPAPNALTLPPLLACLEESGIGRDSITILIATGLHRAATPEEIVEICGPQIASEYRVVNHDARNLAAHRYLGQTLSGTPVYIDERFMAADLHISLGFIEPHLMAGFSGGR
ncbi:MAG TPA: lactate racemase domain-containing protein, partial [Terracidiphilus sp.]|nr:lactate racemase domain-containing protein [Terracidiphilus sp.]